MWGIMEWIDIRKMYPPVGARIVIRRKGGACNLTIRKSSHCDNDLGRGCLGLFMNIEYWCFVPDAPLSKREMIIKELRFIGGLATESDMLVVKKALLFLMENE